jgi:hypothetical protein
VRNPATSTHPAANCRGVRAYQGVHPGPRHNPRLRRHLQQGPPDGLGKDSRFP